MKTSIKGKDKFIEDSESIPDSTIKPVFNDVEKKYKTLFDNAPVGLSVVDSARNILEANIALEKIARISKRELQKGTYKKRKYLRSDGSEMPELELPTVVALKEKRLIKDAEIGIVDENKKTFWLQVSVAPLDQEGNFGVVITQDITDRKNLETLLKASEENYRTFFENSLDAILITSQDGTIHSANHAACTMLGYTENEICKLGRTGIVQQSDSLVKSLQERKRTGKFFGELIFIKKDQTSVPVELSSSVFTDSDGKEVTTIIFRDITERKKVENELYERDERLRTIMEYSGLGIGYYGVDGKILMFNGEALKNLGGKVDDYIGKNVIDIFGREAGLTYIDRFKKTAESEFPLQFEDNVELGGNPGWYLSTHTRILKSDGNIDGIQVIADNITNRKVAELALKQASEWQENIFEGSQDAIFISDAGALLIAVNNAACDLTGYSKEELLKMHIPELHDDLDLEAYRKYHKKIFKGEKILSEAKIRRRDGVKVDAEFNNSRISISGRFYMHTTARDISARREAEMALKQSEERYRNLFENSPIGISATSMSGELLQANLPFAKMYGYESVEQMKSELPNVSKLFSNPDQRANLIKFINENGRTDAMELEVIRRDGSKFFVLSSGVEVRDISGSLLYFQTSHIDLTERKKIEEVLRSSSLYARTLIEASLDPLVTINIEGKITDVNTTTEQITGINRKKLINTDFADYFTDPDKAREGYKTVFKNGIVKNYPLSILHTSGREIDVLYNASLFKNENGDVQGVFAAARDITDQKKMEKELQKSHELLEKLNQHLVDAIEEERNQIALNLHDDLGQKLTAINLDIAWLKSRIGVQSRTVREKFEEMSSMIKETIESTKKTSAFLRPAILFDLGMVSAIKSHLVNFEKQTGIKCNFNFSPEEFLLEDKLSLILYRIFQESMTNIARHAGASTTDVTLSVSEKKIELIIKDDGRGIERNKVKSIKSMGIAGIRERVKSVNGKISIIGVHDSGTMIKVVIPLLKVKTND